MGKDGFLYLDFYSVKGFSGHHLRLIEVILDPNLVRLDQVFNSIIIILL